VVQTDSDNDGIPNIIEDQHAFLNPTNASDASLDQDGDGVSNFGEFLGNTDMATGTDFPRISMINKDNPAGITVQVDARMNRYY